MHRQHPARGSSGGWDTEQVLDEVPKITDLYPHGVGDANPSGQE